MDMPVYKAERGPKLPYKLNPKNKKTQKEATPPRFN